MEGGSVGSRFGETPNLEKQPRVGLISKQKMKQTFWTNFAFTLERKKERKKFALICTNISFETLTNKTWRISEE